MRKQNKRHKAAGDEATPSGAEAGSPPKSSECASPTIATVIPLETHRARCRPFAESVEKLQERLFQPMAFVDIVERALQQSNELAERTVSERTTLRAAYQIMDEIAGELNEISGIDSNNSLRADESRNVDGDSTGQSLALREICAEIDDEARDDPEMLEEILAAIREIKARHRRRKMRLVN